MVWRASAKRCIDGINHFAALVCYVLLFVITSVTVLQVFLRFVLNRPTSWSEEVALLCLIWFGLLAVAVGVRRHEHIAIMFVRDMLPPTLAKILDILAQFAIAAFMSAILFYTDELVLLVGSQMLPASGLPKSLLYVPAMIGGFLGLVNAVANVALSDLHARPFDSPGAADVR